MTPLFQVDLAVIIPFKPPICYTNRMSAKKVVMLGMIIGSLIGGYAPVLIGINPLSFISLLTSAVGGVIGIIVASKLIN